VKIDRSFPASPKGLDPMMNPGVVWMAYMRYSN